MLKNNICVNDLLWKSSRVLEENKKDLTHVLRYFGNWTICPIEIEDAVKFIYWKQLDVELNKPYDISWKKIIYTKNHQWNIEFIDEKWKKYNFQLSKDNNGLLLIDYNWNQFRELPWSWNSYSHTKSQWELMECFMSADKNGWIISDYESKLLSLLNNFHDVVEKYTMDICLTKKSSTDRNSEKEYFENVLEYFPYQYRSSVKDIEHQLDNTYSLFKFYERLIYFTHDINMFEKNEAFLPKNSYNVMLFNQVSWLFIFDETWNLPNWKKIKWIDIPSFKESFLKNKEYLETKIEELKKIIANKELDNNYSYVVSRYNITIQSKQVYEIFNLLSKSIT